MIQPSPLLSQPSKLWRSSASSPVLRSFIVDSLRVGAILPGAAELLRKEIIGVPPRRAGCVGSVQQDAQVDARQVGGRAVVERQGQVVARLMVVRFAKLLLQRADVEALLASLVAALQHQRRDALANERELVAADEADFLGRRIR